MKKMVLVLFVCLISGCATAGNRIEPSKVSQIKEGVTTETEVVNILGAPQFKTLTSDGKTLMTYSYAKIRSRAENFIPFVNLLSNTMDMNQQTLTVLLDKNNVVEKYTTNNSDTQIRSGLLDH